MKNRMSVIILTILAALLLCTASASAAYNGSDIVYFGHYPQTGSGNDSSPIAWYVIGELSDGTLGLVSRDCLDIKPFNDSWTETSWSSCEIRSWLNHDFLSKAFSSSEQGFIYSMIVDNSTAQAHPGAKGEANTTEKVYLLSYAEVTGLPSYLRTAGWTDYARRRADYAIGSEAEWYVGTWWTRSMSDLGNDGACCVFDNGEVDVSPCYEYLGVRPVIWVNPSAL